MDAARKLFITGLRNAHAMERQAQELMERQSERMTEYPEVQEKCREHLEETGRHLVRLEECLDKLGESRSGLKDMTMALGGNLSAMMNAMAGDEVLKNTLANSGFEHFEVAAYKSLLAIDDAGGLGCQALLQQNLAEDQRMAAWVDENVPKVTLEFLRAEQRRAA